MLRRSSLLLGLLFATPFVHAIDICCYPDCDYAVQYPYAGVMVSGVQINNSLNTAFPKDNPIFQDGVKFSSAQLTGGLALGWASRWSGRWYFAGEVSSQPVYINGTKTWTGESGFNYDNELKLMNFFNADGIPGYYFCRNLLVYLRAGIAVGTMTFDQNNFLGTNYSSRNTVAGYRGGVGFDYTITRRWSAGLDYIYTNYGTQKFDETIIMPGIGTTTLRTENRFFTNLVGLHINFKFV